MTKARALPRVTSPRLLGTDLRIMESRRGHDVAAANVRAAAFPPPLRGRDREGGSYKHRICWYPPPHPSPARGEGAERIRGSGSGTPKAPFSRMPPAIYAATMVAIACWSSSALAAEIPLEERKSGYEFMGRDTRAMQDDDTANPGMLSVLEGETLWSRKAGSA